MKKKLIILTLILTLCFSLFIFTPQKSASAHTVSGGLNENSYFIDYDNLYCSGSIPSGAFSIQVNEITLELNKTDDNHLYIVGLTYNLYLFFNQSGTISIPLRSCVDRYVDISDILTGENSYCFGNIQFEVTILEQELYTRLWIATSQEIIEDYDSCFYFEESFQFIGDVLYGTSFTLDSNRYDLRKSNIPVDNQQIFDEAYQQGYDDGYLLGNQETYDEAYQQGYDDGYYDGLDTDNGESYDNGYKSGYYDGNNDGFIKGYDKGYDIGIINGQKNGEKVNANFGEMILNVLDAPRQALSNILNFDFLGVNIGNLVFFLISTALVVFVIKFFI